MRFAEGYVCFGLCTGGTPCVRGVSLAGYDHYASIVTFSLFCSLEAIFDHAVDWSVSKNRK